MMEKLKILMLGPARNVKGGMTAVVDNYFDYGLDKEVDLKYIETKNDKNIIRKLVKMFIGYFEYIINLKKYDIIHIHMSSRKSTIRKGIYLKTAKRYNKQAILHIHGGEYKIFYENECNERQKKRVREILNLADKIIVLSEEWKNFFKGLVEEEKIEVIYNSIVIPKDFEKNLNTQKILFLGRIGPKKGIYDLLDVIEELIKKYPKLMLYVGGDGETDNIKRIIAERNIENNVKFLNWVKGEEKEKLLRECSFYILPSYNEGMPISVIEAMAYKNVTISTEVGGIPSLIKNMENGILVKPGDKEALYKNLELLLEDDKLRKKLSDAARIRAEKDFNINSNMKKILDLYNNLSK